MQEKGVTIITATGNRPEALQLCAKYVLRQDWEGILQWIVVDDGVPESVIPALPDRVRLHYISAPNKWDGKTDTLRQNMLLAIKSVEFDLIFIFEDDDWYSPTYIRNQIRRMGEAELVGEVPSLYYHLPSRQYLMLNNRSHASLCQTGFRRSFLPIFSAACHGNDSFIDIRLWTAMVYKILHESRRVIGMKGLPGRPGIGIGHRPERVTGWLPDPEMQMLESWIGLEDANEYRGLV
jgi:glycosyltransferase involved in cell wall biosynthesis